jgi:predicted negative regulator of RcsB-dependent stress response
MEHSRLVDEDQENRQPKDFLTRNGLAVALALAVVSLIGVSIALGLRSNDTRANNENQVL